MNLLVVGESFRNAQLLGSGLETGGHSCALAFSAYEGLARAKSLQFDAIILDQRLIDRPGIEVVRELRRVGVGVPAIMLAGQGESDQRVVALSAGASDFLVRPFSTVELLGRVESVCRRVGHRSSTPAAVELSLDKRIRGVRANGRAIRLSPREYSILECLFENRGKSVSRAEVCRHVWRTTDATYTRLVPVYVNRLRRKIDRGVRPSVIETVRGEGYRVRQNGSIENGDCAEAKTRAH
jgi:two-component system, OmpR family, response regulator